MKKIQLFVIMAFVIGLSSMSFAQNSANANAAANANVAKGIHLTWNQNLAFGNLTTPTTAATAVIGVNGVNIINANYYAENPVCTNTSTIAVGNNLYGGDGSPGPAVFTVTGQFGYTFAVTLPSGASIPVVIQNNNPGPTSNTLTIDNLTVCVGGNGGVPGNTGTLSIGAGTQFFAVGGTLHLPANAPSGFYQNPGPTDFVVSVAYN